VSHFPIENLSAHPVGDEKTSLAACAERMNMSEDNSGTAQGTSDVGPGVEDVESGQVLVSFGGEEVVNLGVDKTITGSAAADTIVFTSANTTVEAGDGANTITGTSGNNLISAGIGADTITVTTGHNTIDAGSGINTITAMSGNNHITAGDGADTITLTSGNNKINAGGGINTIAATTGNNSITTGDGADTITVSTGDNTIHAGGGANTITASSGNNTITAGDGADTITTSGLAGGSNTIHAGNGANTVTTGAGNDTVTSGNGADTITTGAGDDMITIKGGIDTIAAGAGNDTLIADLTLATGAVSLSALAGTAAAGYAGNISGLGIATFAGVENFEITSGDFNDTITTGDGTDVVHAGGGNDIVNLGGGDDEAIYTMAANAGASDVYQGGAGDDTLTLELTQDQWDSDEVKADIADYLAFQEAPTSPSGEAGSAVFQFNEFNLSVSEFENLRVFAGGDEVDPTSVLNDAPLVQVVDFTASLHELADNSAGENTSELSATGVFTFTDVDLTDTHTVSVEAGGADYVGSASAEVTTAATGGETGEVTSVFTVNNADIDYLHDGETLTQTYTAHLLDNNGGRTSTQTATVTITGTNDAPVITSDAVAASGSVIEAGKDDAGAIVDGTPSATGTLTSLDVDTGASATWSGDAAGTYGSFAIDPTTGAWTYTLDNTNTATDTLADGQVETEVFTVMVTDDVHATDTQDVTITVAGTNDKQLIWGAFAGANAGNTASADGGDGDDTISFGMFAGQLSGSGSADGGAGNDEISFGRYAGYDNGSVSADGGDGNDTISFGSYAGRLSGSASADGGAGNDTINFGASAGHSGSVSADGGAGIDEISFGRNAGGQVGYASADGGAGNDEISFGHYAGQVGSASADGGDGNDKISFGNFAGYSGSASADGGAGNDEISFGDNAGGSGSVTANGGVGADTFEFGAWAQNLTIDLGAGDEAEDSVTFLGSVKNTTIDNWEINYDANIDVVDPSAWTAQVENGNTVLTIDDGQSLTLIGITDADLGVSDFLM
jgi:VCBS repeat-containing protein